MFKTNPLASGDYYLDRPAEEAKFREAIAEATESKAYYAAVRSAAGG